MDCSSNRNSSINGAVKAYIFLLFGVVIFVVSAFSSLRDIGIGSDSYVYAEVFKYYLSEDYQGRFEYFFVSLMWLASLVSTDYRFFFFTVSCALLSFSMFALSNLYLKDCNYSSGSETVLITIVAMMLISPFFFSMQTNILRHGLAAPLILATYLYYDERKYKYSAVFALAALGMHWSSAYFIVLAPLLTLKKSSLLMIVSGLSAMYLLNAVEFLIKPTMGWLGLHDVNDFLFSYGRGEDYQVGVRYDFWLFSVILLSLALLAERKLAVEGKAAKFMLVSFIPFLVVGFIPFSDRLLVFLWFMMPVVFAFYVGALLDGKPQVASFVASHFLLGAAVFFNVSLLY